VVDHGQRLDSLGFDGVSSFIEVVVDHGEDLEFPGWVSIGDSGSTLELTRDDA
jgi:hypothetical protein